MGTLAVSAVVRDSTGRYLLVLRSDAPERGRWTLPGGKVETGETLREALVREVGEETGLRVRVIAELGVVERGAPSGAVYEIHCFTADALDGVLAAGSDAAGVRWATVGELRTLNLTRGLLDSLKKWGQV